MVTLSLFAFKPSPTPASVPPVPTAQVKPSTLPSVCAQISSAVPAICARRLAILSNWLAQIAPGVSSAIRRDVCTKWPGLLNGAAGTSTSSAPSARNVSIFSRLCVSGMTMIVLYPLALATSAKPMPVFPAVPSTMVPPGLSVPFASASSTMKSAARSFTDAPGLANSHLPRISHPVASEGPLRRTSGVLPIRASGLRTIIPTA